MSKATVLKGLILATAAAGMFASHAFAAESAEAGAEAKIHCEGVNSCKGTSDCKGASACQGQNSCKGKGFLSMTESECSAAKAKMAEGA